MTPQQTTLALALAMAMALAMALAMAMADRPLAKFEDGRLSNAERKRSRG